MNATAAAKIAGYAQPHSQGPRLLKDEQVRAAIKESMKTRFDADVMEKEEVLARVSQLARANLADIVRDCIDEWGRLDKAAFIQSPHSYTIGQMEMKTDRLGRITVKLKLRTDSQFHKLLMQYHQLLDNQEEETTAAIERVVVKTINAVPPPNLMIKSPADQRASSAPADQKAG